MNEIIRGIIIHLVVPLMGVGAYIYLCLRMHRHKIPRPPYLPLFIIFSSYGGLLLVALTVAFWYWSGMASLGTFYLTIGSPVVMGLLAAHLRLRSGLSVYHQGAFWAAAIWLAIWGGGLCLMGVLYG